MVFFKACAAFSVFYQANIRISLARELHTACRKLPEIFCWTQQSDLIPRISTPVQIRHGVQKLGIKQERRGNQCFGAALRC